MLFWVFKLIFKFWVLNLILMFWNLIDASIHQVISYLSNECSNIECINKANGLDGSLQGNSSNSVWKIELRIRFIKKSIEEFIECDSKLINFNRVLLQKYAKYAYAKYACICAKYAYAYAMHITTTTSFRQGKLKWNLQ